MKQQKAQPKKGPKRAKRRSKIDPFHSLVGQLVDREVAEKAGVTPAAVQAYRRKHGIPAASSGGATAGDVAGPATPTRGPKRRKARKSKVDPYFSLLGQVPDRVVAEKAGVTIGAVQAYRRRFSIPSTRAQRDTSQAPRQSSATTAAPSVASGGAGARDLAWKVTLVDGDVRVVIAPALTDAVARVEGLGTVVKMDRVGPVL